MPRSRQLPRPLALMVVLTVLSALPLAFYMLVRAGAQPGADFLARQFGGTAAVTLPSGLVHALAFVAALYGAVVDLRMLAADWPPRSQRHRVERDALGRPTRRPGTFELSRAWTTPDALAPSSLAMRTAGSPAVHGATVSSHGS